MSESVAVRRARPYCWSRVYTDEAEETIARTVRLFEARVEHCGRVHAVEEFLLSEETALARAPDYAEHLDRLRIYDEAWRTAIVLHRPGIAGSPWPSGQDRASPAPSGAHWQPRSRKHASTRATSAAAA